MICLILLENALIITRRHEFIYLPQNVYGTVSLAVLNWFGAPHTSFSHSVTAMYSYVLDEIL
nr:MAG TPA: hypothetical protein [Bacteriophage sp.]